MGWNIFGNGPAAPVTISRAEIEAALKGRGYTKGVFREVAVPRYTKAQAITMGVDRALSQMGLATKPPTRVTLEPARWKSVIDVGLMTAQTMARSVERKRELTPTGVPRERVAVPAGPYRR